MITIPGADSPVPQRMPITIPGHLFAELPFYEVETSDRTVIVDLHNRPDVVNVRGALQGGLVATLIDVAGGQLALAAAGSAAGVSTADMTVHFVAAVLTGPARAVATIVRTGRRLIVVAVDVYDVGGNRLAARATLTFAVLGAPGGQPPMAPGGQPATAPGGQPPMAP